jgi:hypothetical protein
LTFTHTSHKDIEQSTTQASITLDGNTDWLTDQVITEIQVSTDKMLWTSNKPAQWTLYIYTQEGRGKWAIREPCDLYRLPVRF